MENPGNVPPSPELKPRIRKASDKIKLMSEQEELLRQYFATCTEIYIEKEFGEGFSGAAIYLISFTHDGYAPVVAKFDHPATLQREANAYAAAIHPPKPKHEVPSSETLVPEASLLKKLQAITPEIGPWIKSKDGKLGLLVYTYAGGDIGHAQSLREYFWAQGGDAVVKVLNRIFEVYGTAWWGKNKTDRIPAQKYYDRLLPAHFHVTALPAAVLDAVIVKPGQTTVAALDVGQPVQLEGFKVHKATNHELTLTAEPPSGVQAASIRVKLKGMSATPGAEISSQTAVITKTRALLLGEFTHKALDTFNVYHKTFTLDSYTFANPLYYLQELLEPTYSSKISEHIHGDFHLDNILVDQFNNPWLIDFAKTGEGPTLFDLQYLEARVLTGFLLNDKQKSAKQLNTVLEALRNEPLVVKEEAGGVKDRPRRIRAPKGVNREAYIVLVGLRRLARHYLVKQSDWSEYYRGLTLALLQLLKFDDFEPVWPLTLAGAAITLQWAGVKGVEPVRPSTRSWFRWAPPAILAAFLALSVVGWYKFPTFLSTILNPAPPSTSVSAIPIPASAPLATPVAGCERKISDVRVQKISTEFTKDTPILKRVLDRGVLLCGVEGKLGHFSFQEQDPDTATVKGLLKAPNSSGPFYLNASGLDADYCRVLATAIFGQYDGHVAFANFTTEKRFDAVTQGEVDVLIRNTTWTVWRDTVNKINFGPVIFHDGQKFMTRDEKISRLQDLQNKTVCIQPNTTTLINTNYLSKTLNLNLKIRTTDNDGAAFLDTKAVISAFSVDRSCDVMAGDTSQLAARQEGNEKVKIIPDYPISYEPLAPSFVAWDSQWQDIVNDAVWATIYAEEIGLTQGNIDKIALNKVNQPGSIQQQFLSTGRQMRENLGLKPDFVEQIIKQLGNYGEIYACNLGGVMPNRGPNQPSLKYDNNGHSWLPNLGGLLISPPFVPD